MTMFAQFFISGIVTGCYLILATIGFSMTRRVEGFLNIAHAELIGVSAFTTWSLNVVLGWPFLLAAAIAILFTALVGLMVGRLIYEPIRKRGPAVMLISSVGVAFVIGGVVEVLVGTGARNLNVPLATSYKIYGVRITDYQILLIFLAAISVVAIALFLNKTRIGLAVRAMATNSELASSRGIDVRQTSQATWLLASGLAGVTGAMLSLLSSLSTNIAFGQILQIIAVAILAGLGSLYAVILAGLIVGLAMDMSVIWLPAGYRPLVAFAVVILVLLFRPEGLAGRKAS